MMAGREFIMLNDYEITRVDSNKVVPFFSLLKLIACSVAVMCSMILLPNVIDEVYEARNNLIEDSLKIRVVANSNTKGDQQFKDELVEKLTPFFMQIQHNTSESKNDEVYADMVAYVDKYYSEGNIKINIGEHLIPPKVGLNTFYPQYYYESLLITIGDGRGDNFWCSIFPKTCEGPSKEKEEEEKSETKVEDGEEEEVTFFIWEWLKSLFS